MVNLSAVLLFKIHLYSSTLNALILFLFLPGSLPFCCRTMVLDAASLHHNLSITHPDVNFVLDMQSVEGCDSQDFNFAGHDAIMAFLDLFCLETMVSQALTEAVPRQPAVLWQALDDVPPPYISSRMPIIKVGASVLSRMSTLEQLVSALGLQHVLVITDDESFNSTSWHKSPSVLRVRSLATLMDQEELVRGMNAARTPVFVVDL